MNDNEFWHQKWASQKIGFHLDDVNPLLTQFWSYTNPQPSDDVFVPLCGKSEDLIWLASKHQSVQAVEVSQIAVRALFAEHFYTPTVTKINNQYELYQFDELAIYCGDFFNAPIEPVDIIYDRAALVALPTEIRTTYCDRLKSLLKPGGRILLVSLDYPQAERAGPPFSVPIAEINLLFADYDVQTLHIDDADEDHPKIAKQGLSRFSEQVFLITRNNYSI